MVAFDSERSHDAAGTAAPRIDGERWPDGPLAEPRPARAPQVKAAHFEFIDGLRGIAASWVVLFHLYVGTLEIPLARVIPRPLGFFFAHGALGVQIFFVISGFVIAYSLRRATITRSYVLNFILRRQIRLDPPYWVVVLLATANLALLWVLHPERALSPMPSAGQVASHFFYLQNILGKGDIVVVFWTLCIEVQFYLFFILLLRLLQQLTRGSASSSSERARLLVLGVPGLVSLAYMVFVDATGPWFIAYWYMFTLGAATSWVIEGRMRARHLFGFGALVLAAGCYKAAPEPFIATLVASDHSSISGRSRTASTSFTTTSDFDSSTPGRSSPATARWRRSAGS